MRNDTGQFPLVGTCRCGRTEFEVSAQPLVTCACHCRGCQHMSSSAYSLTAIFAAESFRVRKGEPVKGGLQGPQLDHYFCSFCKTWMFTRVTGMDEIVNVRPTLLDDPRWSEPFIETMTSAKLPWVQIPARHSFAEFPSLEDLQGLMDDFAHQIQKE